MKNLLGGGGSKCLTSLLLSIAIIVASVPITNITQKPLEVQAADLPTTSGTSKNYGSGTYKWTVTKTGIYKIELKGGGGGAAFTDPGQNGENSVGGPGDRVFGYITLNKGDEVKLVVGGKGSRQEVVETCSAGSTNTSEAKGGKGGNTYFQLKGDTTYQTILLAAGGAGCYVIAGTKMDSSGNLDRSTSVDNNAGWFSARIYGANCTICQQKEGYGSNMNNAYWGYHQGKTSYPEYRWLTSDEIATYSYCKKDSNVIDTDYIYGYNETTDVATTLTSSNKGRYIKRGEGGKAGTLNSNDRANDDAGSGSATITAVKLSITLDCIDVVKDSEVELGRDSKEYDHTQEGQTKYGGTEFGSSTTANTYYTGYKYHSCTSVTLSSSADNIVYRYFEPIKYTVRAHKNTPTDATSAVAYLNDTTWSNKGTYYEKTFTYDSTTMTKPSTMYSLKGWSITDTSWWSAAGTNGDISGDEYSFGTSETLINLTTVDNGIVNLYPKWTKHTYTINYDGNNTTYNIYGDTASTAYTGTTSPTSAEYDSQVTLATNGFSKIGYTFKQWNTKPDGKGNGYSSGATVQKPNFTAEDGGSCTLYAIWEPIKYQIQFNGNSNFNTSQGSYTQQFRYDQKLALTANKFNRDTPYTWSGTYIRDKYNYINWGKSSNKTTHDYSDKAEVHNLTTENNATINLYALWKKEIKLTFNLNGGNYKGSGSSINLYGTIYNSTKSYTFKLDDTATEESLPSYTVQTNTIDAYGTYDSNGLNNTYTKVDADGTTYRFLGWSTNKNAAEPDSKFNIYSTSRSTTYTIYDSTTLYAVWEPALAATVNLNRSLGDLTFKNGTSPVTYTGYITATTANPYLISIIRPGEQGTYIIRTKGNAVTVKIAFDSRITDIYNYGDSTAIWKDDLNPSTSEDLIENQKHGLDREIIGEDYIVRKFYIPQYLGTKRSYKTSNPETATLPLNYYHVMFSITQPSYFYKKLHNTEETITVNGTIYIVNDTSSSAETNPIPSVLDDLKTKLKIRIMN